MSAESQIALLGNLQAQVDRSNFFENAAYAAAPKTPRTRNYNLSRYQSMYLSNQVARKRNLRVAAGSYSRSRYGAALQKKRAARKYTARQNRRTGGYIGLEKKFVDYEYDAAVVQTVASAEADPATALCLNVTAQGDGPSEHDGRKQTTTSVEIRGNVVWSATDAATPVEPGFVRILVIQDRQTNGAQFNSEDVLDDPADADLETCALRNVEFEKRFRILKDFVVKKPQTTFVWDGTSAPSEASYAPFHCYIPLKGMVSNYTSTTAAIANIKDNSIHVMAIGEGGAAILRYVSRCRFFG